MSDVRVSWQVCTLRGHSYSVLSVAFSPDGKRIVSGSQDNLVKVWDAETGAEVSRHTSSVHILGEHPSESGCAGTWTDHSPDNGTG